MSSKGGAIAAKPVTNATQALCNDLGDLAAEQDNPSRLADVLGRSVMTRLLVPKAAGGLGGNWTDLIRAATEVGRVSGSAAWLVTDYAFNAALAGRMDERLQGAIWADPAACVAQALQPEGSVYQFAGDTVVVSGTWKFVTGAAYAQWVLLHVPNPGADDDVLWVPRAQFSAVDLDHLGGLRGAGFQNLVAEAIEVPRQRVITRAALFAESPEGVAIDASHTGSAEVYWLNAQLGSVLGCAQGGYEEYRQITSQWVGGIAGNKVAELTQVQSRLGHTHIELKLAALLLDDMLRRVGTDRTSLLAGERSHLGRLCLDAVARLVQQMGARGLFDQNPVQRRYRDLRAMVAHAAFDWRRNLASLGRSELGVADE